MPAHYRIKAQHIATLNWIDAVKKWLQSEQVSYNTYEKQNFSTLFCTLYFPEKAIWLVLIDLQLWQTSLLSSTYWINVLKDAQASKQPVVLLWEDQWQTQQALVKSRLLVKLGQFNRIHARHTFVNRIDMPTLAAFLQKNHLQGSTSAKVKLGLFLKKQYVEKYIHSPRVPIEDTLVAVASFSAGRTMKWGDRANARSFELLRFSSLQSYVVVGGFDKLLQAFIEAYQPDDIMTYADRDWSDGQSYTKLGFETIIQAENPIAFWIHPTTFERHIAKRIEKEHTPTWLSQQGWIPIWNSGSLKFIKQIDSTNV